MPTRPTVFTGVSVYEFALLTYSLSPLWGGSGTRVLKTSPPSRAPSTAHSKKPRRLQRQSEEVAPDHLIDCKLRLRLLRDRVHVAEAAFERIAFENRGGAGGEIGRLGDLASLLAQMDRGHAQPHALGKGDGIVLCRAPNLVPGSEEKRARRRELRLGNADLRLDQGIVAQNRSSGDRRFGLRQLDKRIQHGAGDAERDRG